MVLGTFYPQEAPQDDPRSAQDGPRGCPRATFSLFKFVLNFDRIFDRFLIYPRLRQQPATALGDLQEIDLFINFGRPRPSKINKNNKSFNLFANPLALWRAVGAAVDKIILKKIMGDSNIDNHWPKISLYIP